MTRSGISNLISKKYTLLSGVRQGQALRIRLSRFCLPQPHLMAPSGYGVLPMVHVCVFFLAIESLFIRLRSLHQEISFPVDHSLVSYIYGMSATVRILRVSRAMEIYSKLPGTPKRLEWQLASHLTLFR